MRIFFLSQGKTRKGIWKTKRFNPLIVNPTKWSNTLKQFVGKMPTSYLSVFDHFVGLAIKGLNNQIINEDVFKQINLIELNSPKFVLLVLSMFFVDKVSARQICIFIIFILL